MLLLLKGLRGRVRVGDGLRWYRRRSLLWQRGNRVRTLLGQSSHRWVRLASLDSIRYVSRVSDDCRMAEDAEQGLGSTHRSMYSLLYGYAH